MYLKLKQMLGSPILLNNSVSKLGCVAALLQMTIEYLCAYNTIRVCLISMININIQDFDVNVE